MIWFAKRRAFAEAIRPELEALRTPPATAELRDRILNDRAAGVRVILPAERARRRPATRYLIAATFVVAAMLALPIYRTTTDEMRDADSATMFSYFGGVARAQEPPSIVSQIPAALPLQPERVHAGTLQYLREWRDSTNRVTKRVSRVLSVTPDGPNWRVVDSAHDGATISAETLLVSQRDLRLVARTVHVQPYRRWRGINIEQHFSGDSVSGRMTLDDVRGMRPIARRLPAAYAPYIADKLAPIFFATIPLRENWEGRLAVLGWAVVPTDVLAPIELRVTGDEFVRVPAGRFECWKLNVRYQQSDFDYFVRKSDGIAVRTFERLPDGGRRIVTLVHETGM